MKSQNFHPKPCDLQARRVRWQTGTSRSLARTVAVLAFGEARQ